MANNIKKRVKEFEELNLQTFMSLMVVLIPILLLSAEFAKISIINIKLPESRGSQTNTAVKKQKKEDDSNKLLLTAIITDSVVTLGAKSAFLPSVFYQEFHHYVAKDDQEEVTVRFDPANNVPPKHPKTGREMTIYERYDINLYACKEDFSELIKSQYYAKTGEMVTSTAFNPILKVSVGDTVLTLSNPRRTIIVTDPAEFELRPLSVYDVLKNRLMQVKERFKESDDNDAIIIAAENEVMYDKIVQIMDAARGAEFPKISIAKLRS